MLSDWISKKKLPDVRAKILDVPVPPEIEQALSSRFPLVKCKYTDPWCRESKTLVYRLPLDWNIELISTDFIWAPVDLTNSDNWDTVLELARFVGFCPVEDSPVVFAIILFGLDGPKRVCYHYPDRMALELANYLTQAKEFTSWWSH